MRSERNLQGIEHMNLTKICARRQDTTRMSANGFRGDVPTVARYTATGLAIQSKERGVHRRRWRIVTDDGILFSESLRKKDWLLTSLNSNSRTCGFLKKSEQETEKERARDRAAAAAHSSKSAEEEGDMLSILDGRKVENVPSDMTRQRRRKAKELDQEAWLSKTLPQKDNTPESHGEVHQAKKIVLRVSTAKEEMVVMIESVTYLHLPHCKYFREELFEMGNDCPFVHPPKKKRTTSLPRKERV